MKTEVRTIGLQVGFAVGVIVFIILSYLVGSARLGATIDQSIQMHLDPGAPLTPIATALVRVIVRDIEVARIQHLEIDLIGVLFLMIIFAIITARIVLAPTRNALASQKQFIGNIAHELRTPLSVIKTNSEIALYDPNIPAGLKETVESNVEELDRISEIINNLLSLSSLTRPEQMEFGSIDLAALASETVSKYTALAARNNVQITVRKGTDGRVWGNMTALQQILNNLIKNAITYTPRGGSVMITIWPSANDQVELVIRDTGVGIARKDLFRVFEPFYRADPSRSRVSAGSGLGLTIVSELVRLHHGKISVRSEVGTGTTVSVILPNAPESTNTLKKNRLVNINEIRVDYSNNSR